MRLSLTPAPTFKATARVPVPGGEPADIVCTFRHRSRSELTELFDGKPPDGDYLMAILVGWDLDDEFNRENVDRLIEMHHGAPTAISEVYLTELTGGRPNFTKVAS